MDIARKQCAKSMSVQRNSSKYNDTILHINHYFQTTLLVTCGSHPEPEGYISAKEKMFS